MTVGAKEDKVSSEVMAICLNTVSVVRAYLEISQSQLEIAAYKLEREQKRLEARMLENEGRKTVADPIDVALTAKNDAVLTLLDAECEAAADLERLYAEVAKAIRNAIDELEDK